MPSRRATQPTAVHPLGSRAKVLLTSVFGPYAQDDEYGSRQMNPMELYHNQVTRTQGAFSLRMFHRSWGIMLIQANIEAPCTLLDFPAWTASSRRFATNQYDVVGITAITAQSGQGEKMCELIRQHQPNATIVVGGHVANMPELGDRVDADYVVKGDGVAWFRRFLGEDVDRPIRHPAVVSGIGTRNMGVTLRDRPGDVAATLIPSVGCPLGCNFCSTSAMFGGKGKSVNFYQTGDELFDIMCQLERDMQVSSFFVMDENFLLHRKRALRLLELMRSTTRPGRSTCSVPPTSCAPTPSSNSSAWASLGFGWASRAATASTPSSRASTPSTWCASSVARHPRAGLDDHRLGKPHAGEHRRGHRTRRPPRHRLPPVHALHAHPRHPAARRAVGPGQMKDPASTTPATFTGSSSSTTGIRTSPRAWKASTCSAPSTAISSATAPARCGSCAPRWPAGSVTRIIPTPRIRRRYAFEARELATTFSAAVAGAKLYYRDNPEMRAKMSALLDDLHREFGWKSRLFSASAAGMCSRRSAAKRSGWPPAGPTSRLPSTRRTTLARRGRGPLPLRRRGRSHP